MSKDLLTTLPPELQAELRAAGVVGILPLNIFQRIFRYFIWRTPDGRFYLRWFYPKERRV